MDNGTEITHLLERIAAALERIADSIAENDQSIIPPDLEELEASDPPEVEDNLQVTNDITPIQDFLASRGILIKAVPPGQDSDETLDKLAIYIGTKLESVNGVLNLIKSNMNAGRTFSQNLKNEPQQTIANTTFLCTNLYNVAFLTDYNYQKSPVCRLHATPSTAPSALNFFSGGWLERFVKTQVISLLKKKNLQFSYVCNPQITLPNGDDFEMDMLFEAEGEIFWLEAKSGDYRRHIDKYSKMSKLLGLDPSHTFMILADSSVTDSVTRDLSNLFSMTVVRAEKFADQLFWMLTESKDRVVEVN